MQTFGNMIWLIVFQVIFVSRVVHHKSSLSVHIEKKGRKKDSTLAHPLHLLHSWIEGIFYS
jgi:hypothetical protein